MFCFQEQPLISTKITASGDPEISGKIHLAIFNAGIIRKLCQTVIIGKIKLL